MVANKWINRRKLHQEFSKNKQDKTWKIICYNKLVKFRKKSLGLVPSLNKNYE